MPGYCRLFLRWPVALAAAFALLGGPAAHAMKLKPQNLTQLITDSQSIIAGKVTRVTDGVASTNRFFKVRAD